MKKEIENANCQIEKFITLKLENIKKVYGEGETAVQALKGIDLSFRKSEFVSILGPSGCGKTTLLNIIGGLDHYSSGDLFINGKSTKDFNERDWDAYRNYSIGFVFQSYNLIPHQTVLANVELALTLSGVGKLERRKRAKKVLEQVGLSGQEHKRPNQLSGGQMQRVAIARALVNNPDIILADEPTGALDSETSIQVMDILKEVAKDRLVVMVTHNGEIAQNYSTRIVKMLDGVIEGDSNPINEEQLSAKDEVIEQPKIKVKKRKPSMSLLTSFGLSLKNLISKKGRTILTSFAGSVGIIGIALIYAVSQGATNYINLVQEETLGSYPLTLEAEHTDLGGIMEKFMNLSNSSIDHDKEQVYEQDSLYEFIEAINSAETQTNDLKSFKVYLEEQMKDENSTFSSAISGVQYTYDLDMLIYTESVDKKIIVSDAQKLLAELLTEYAGNFSNSSGTLGSMAMSGIGNFYTSSLGVWQEMLPGQNGKVISPLIEKQYEVVYGSWPNDYNEVVLVLDKNNEIDDITLYSLGLKPESEVREILQAAFDGKPLDKKEEAKSWSYEDICNIKYKTILNSDCYQYEPNSNKYIDIRESEAGLRYLYSEKGIDLKISGVIRPKEDTMSPILSCSIGYTSKLTEQVIQSAKDSQAIKAQLQDGDVDIFTNKLFKNSSGLTTEEKANVFREYAKKLSDNEKAQLYVDIMCIPPESFVESKVSETLSGMTRNEMEELVVSALKQQTSITEEQLRSYIASMSDEQLKEYISAGIREQVELQYAQGVKANLSSLSTEQKAGLLNLGLTNYSDEKCAEYYEKVMEFSESSLEENLRKLGYVDISSPKTINLYATSFENKDLIDIGIKEYNKGVVEEKQIEYVDYVGIMMKSVTTIINAITYVLIAFVAVSLIVSAIMIGVITLISVQERTKEIGILRAIGASKRNVSSLFNAETIIIGLIAGVIGVGLTYLLCVPINLILRFFTGIANLRALLPIPFALILIAISVLLTMIAGIIPSRSAAKKDPVVALRLE